MEQPQPPAGSFEADSSGLTHDGRSLPVLVATVSPAYFDSLKAQPLLGRSFVASDYGGARPTAVLAHAVWEELFQGSPTVIGTEVSIGGGPAIVVGIMPEGLRPPPDAGVYVPAHH